MMRVLPARAPALAVAFVYCFCLFAGYFVLRPLRDTMGIQGGIASLKWLFTADFAITLLVVVPLFGFLVARFSRRRLVPGLHAFLVAVVALFAVAFAALGATPALARTFFVWMGVFNLFVVSVFWAFMADVFGPDGARRLYGRIAAGGTLGAMAGPAMAAVVPSPPVLLAVSAALLAVAGGCAAWLARGPLHGGTAAEAGLGGGLWEGVGRLARSPYLALVAVWLVLFTATATFAYLEQATLVQAFVPDQAARTRLFAWLDLGANGLALGLQLGAAGPLLTRLGPRAALVGQPVITAAGFLALVLAPALAPLVVFQVVRRGAGYGLLRPAREALFAVVPGVDRYKAKAVVDTAVYRAGDAASAWGWAGLAAVGLGPAALAAVALPVVCLWGGAGWYLGRRYRTMQAAEDS